MNSTLLAVILGLIACLAIGGLCWLFGRRPTVGPVGERVEGALRAQIDSQRADLVAASESRLKVERALATAEARAVSSDQRLEEQRALHAEQLNNLRTDHDRNLAQMRDSFSALSSEALTQMQPQFLALANETLAKQSEVAKGDLSQRQEAIAGLLKPVEELLRASQARLAQSETTQSAALGEVKKGMELLAQNSAGLAGETLQLRQVLGNSTARGRWGEETLRRTVEASGMSVHCDFVEQAQAGDARPDLIVKLPGNRVILVDAKCPDFGFLSALNQGDEVKRTEALRLHAEKLRGTIKALADRDYPSQFQNSLDYVVLFVPAESLFSAALEADRELITWAQQRRIILATPATLIALLKSASLSWLQNDQTVNAKKIADEATELFSRVASLVRHFEAIRSGLARASSAFNDAVGSYERSVRPQGAKVLALGVGSSGKELPEVEAVSEVLRIPQQESQV